MRGRIWIAVAAVGALAFVAGLVVLFLPFDHTLELGLPGLGSLPTVTVRCKGPVIDALTSEGGDTWINYAPDTGVQTKGPSTTGDENCAPTSARRGMAGSALALAGTAVAGASWALRRRSKAVGDEPDAPEGPDPVDAA